MLTLTDMVSAYQDDASGCGAYLFISIL
jgi:hypothetical protein